MKPTVLIATTTNWVPTARLAVALADAGFRVETLCPPGHPVSQTHVVHQYEYQGLTPLRSFARAIARSKPDLVVPGDDLATRHLHDLYQQRDRYSTDRADIGSLIKRSLGSPEAFPVIQSRASFMELALKEGIRVPKTEILKSIGDLENWLARTGLPTVLKADGTSGGDGVRMVRTSDDARFAFRKLQQPAMFARAIKRAVFDRDRTLVWPSLKRTRPTVNAQTFVVGHEATSTVSCWNGVVLASLHFEVLRKCNDAGHATVVRLIDHPEMTNAVKKMVRRMGLSGMCGFDFMLEASTGNAYLIEINPRSTQVGHITLGAGKDLPAALYSAVSGYPMRVAAPVTDNDTIALFPHEWARDPRSEYLRTGYHDVPWDTPGLVHVCMRRSRKQSAWYSRREVTRELVLAVPPVDSSSESKATAGISAR